MGFITPARLIATGTLGVAATLGLAACGGSEQEPQSETAPTDGTVPDEGRGNATRADRPAVRTMHTDAEAVEWLPVDGKSRQMYELSLGHLNRGDHVEVRSDLALTNDLATSSAQRGATYYKGEARYPVRAEGVLTAIDGAGASRVGVHEQDITPQNHHNHVRVRDAFDVSRNGKVALELDTRATLPDGSAAPNECYTRDYGDSRANPDGSCALRVDTRKGQLDALIMEPGWESEFAQSSLSARGGDIEGGTLSVGETRVVMSVPLGAVKKGEVFDARSLLAARSGNGSPQLLSGALVLSDEPFSGRGRDVSSHNGFNMPAGGSGTLDKQGAFTARKDMDAGYLNLVVNSNSDSSDPDRLTLDPGQSSLDITRYTPRA